MSRQRLLIYGALAVLVAIWGTTWAVIRIGLEGIPPFTGISLRFGLAAVLLLAYGRLVGARWRFDRQILRLWIVETLFSFCLSYGIVYWAEQWLPSSWASVLFATFPLFVVVMAHLWLESEPFHLPQILGVLLGFAGVVVIFSDDLSSLGGRPALLAALVMLGSPICAAVAHVLVKKWGSGVDPLTLTTMPMAATALIMGALAVIFESDRAVVFDSVSVGALLYLAVFGSAVTFTIFYWLLARLPATQLSLITYAIPVVAVLLGTLVLHEPFTLRMGAGGALVVLGVVGASRRG